MKDNYILKLCLYSAKTGIGDIIQFLYQLDNLERIYSNIYRQEYRSGIRYEDTTFLKKYTEKEALRLLNKRMDISQTPFFLDFYKTGKEEEFVAIARTGKYTILYMRISSDNYSKHRSELEGYCEELTRTQKLYFGYSGRNATEEEIPWRRLIYARHNRSDYGLEEEDSLLKTENILKMDYYTNEADIIIWSVEK